MTNYLQAIAQLVNEGVLPAGLQVNAVGGESDYDALVMRGAEKPARDVLVAAAARFMDANPVVDGLRIVHSSGIVSASVLNGFEFSYRINDSGWQTKTLDIDGVARVTVNPAPYALLAVEIVEREKPFRRGLIVVEA